MITFGKESLNQNPSKYIELSKNILSSSIKKEKESVYKNDKTERDIKLCGCCNNIDYSEVVDFGFTRHRRTIIINRR